MILYPKTKYRIHFNHKQLIKRNNLSKNGKQHVEVSNDYVYNRIFLLNIFNLNNIKLYNYFKDNFLNTLNLNL